jgi:hypothetical protein
MFELLEFLERLAAMTPRPEKNLLICHGLLAARALGAREWSAMAGSSPRARPHGGGAGRRARRHGGEARRAAGPGRP